MGDVLEREPDRPRRHLSLLAYHYSRSEDLPKMRHYLSAAATAARAAYANEAAVSYLEQVSRSWSRTSFTAYSPSSPSPWSGTHPTLRPDLHLLRRTAG